MADTRKGKRDYQTRAHIREREKERERERERERVSWPAEKQSVRNIIRNFAVCATSPRAESYDAPQCLEKHKRKLQDAQTVVSSLSLSISISVSLFASCFELKPMRQTFYFSLLLLLLF